MRDAWTPNDVLVAMMCSLVVAGVIFLAIRQFWLWYWKLNLIEAHLAELVDLQRKAQSGRVLPKG